MERHCLIATRPSYNNDIHQKGIDSMISDIIFIPGDKDFILRFCLDSSQVPRIAEFVQENSRVSNFYVGSRSVQAYILTTQVIPFLHDLAQTQYINTLELDLFITRFHQLTRTPFTSFFSKPNANRNIHRQPAPHEDSVRRAKPQDFPFILEQIKRDIFYLYNSIHFLRSRPTWLTYNGVLLYGLAYEMGLQHLIALKIYEMRKLQTILASRIIPEHYFSQITGLTYFHTPEEKTKIPFLPSHFSLCVKKSRKNTGQYNSSFILSRPHKTPIRFLAEHRPTKNYPQGTYAKSVKQGFEGSELKYAMKVFKPKNPALELSLAMRASFCLKLLGRETATVFCNNDKRYLLSDWQTGQNLTMETAQQFTIADRVLFAMQLTRELNILHANGIIHRDVKPENVILSKKLTLIDFDSVSAKGELSTHAIYTPRFLSSQLYLESIHNNFTNFNEKSDMYALGLTLGILFAELFSPQLVTNQMNDPDISSVLKHETLQLQRTSEYANHKHLWELIFTLVTESCPDTISSFLQDLSQLYIEEYHQTLPDDFDVGEKIPRVCGKTEFEQIEKEISVYLRHTQIHNDRYGHHATKL